MAQRKPPVIPDALLDYLLAGADAKRAFDRDGLLDELKKALAERALNAEMDHHLQASEEDGNRRNGYGKKTVLTGTGKIALEVPRDRLLRGDNLDGNGASIRMRRYRQARDAGRAQPDWSDKPGDGSIPRKERAVW